MISLNAEMTVESNRLGNKAKNLILLKKHGFHVPDGVVIDTDLYERAMLSTGLKKEISRLFQKLDGTNIREISKEMELLFSKVDFSEKLFEEIKDFIRPDKAYAVRSSGTLEDCENYSFAGLYRTHLYKRGSQEIKWAVEDCWASLFSEPILEYLYHNHIAFDEPKMAVIIQDMVDADYSGVAFTVNPITGNDREILVEVACGTGEDLVSGKIRPENYSYDWYRDTCNYKDENKILSEKSLKEISVVFKEIQKMFGYPCDIEFALKDGELFILQARAITKIGYSQIKDMWTTADFRDGGVSATTCIPYMWSLYEYVWDHALRTFVIDSKLLSSSECEGTLGEIFFGRPYWNLSFVKKVMSVVPGYKEREFDASYGVTPNYEGDGQKTKLTLTSLFRVLKIVVAQKKILKDRETKAQKYKNLLSDKYRYYRETLDETMSISEFEKKWYDLTHEHYLKSETIYFWQIFINEIHQTLYKEKITKHMGYADYLELLNGITDISHLRPFVYIRESTRLIRSCEEAYQYWKTTPSEQMIEELSEGKYYLNRVSEFLERYGYHSDRELDVSYPCYYEDLPAVIEMFRTSLLSEGVHEDSDDGKMQHRLYEMRMESLKQKLRKRKFKRLKIQTEKIRNMLWWREEFRDLSTMLYYIIRIYTIRLGEIYKKEGILDSKEDIWMSRVGDIWDFQEGKIDKREFICRLSKNKDYYLSFRNFLSENEIGSTFKPVQRQSNDKNLLCGTGCNVGVISGVARVIHSIEEIDKLQKNDILVTKYTDTGWSGKFALLSGLITEFGGVLCHGAIVAREYGIPCIASVTDATKKIKDGSLIKMDGETGEIFLLSEDGSKDSI